MAPVNADVVNGSKVTSPVKKTLPEVEDSNGKRCVSHRIISYIKKIVSKLQ